MAARTYIKKRSDGRYRLNLRVPTDLVDLVGVAVMNDSLHTSDRTEALVKARAIREQCLQAWDALRAGQDEAARLRFEAARAICRQHGVPFRSSDDLLAGSTREVVARLDRALQATSSQERVALTGGVQRSALRVSELVGAVEHHFRVELADKTDRQRHRWRLARVRAVNNFVGVVGNRAVTDISRDDGLDFRDWWADRMLDEGLSADSPNKDFQHLGRMLRIMGDAKRLDIGDPFRGLRFGATRPVRPHPLTPDELRLALAAVDRLNLQARTIVEVLVQTGLRPTEAVNDVTYHLTSNVPHVEVGRLKTANAARRIPLIGRALEAARACPDAFAVYAEREASLCAVIGKWLRSLFPDLQRVSAYSFRHGFQDRLIAVDVAERVQADLMGHAYSRERYGAGASLEHLQEVLENVRID